jgi:phosphate/phosphite/phosphonate ABC transporter binding protein
MAMLLVFLLVFSSFLPINPLCANDDAKTAVKSEVKVLRFGRIPFLDPRKMVKDHEPLMQYLKKTLKLDDCRLVLAPNYEKLTEFLKNGKVDIAWHGTLAYPHAFNAGAGKAVLRPVRYGADNYKGIIIARTDSPINSVKDLKGKSFAYTDPESASGYYYPRITMLKNGLDPDTDLGTTKYVRKHDNILYAILFKRFDAGAVYDDAREHLKNKAERDQLKIIARTPPISNEPIMVSNDLPKDFVEDFVNTMLALKKEDSSQSIILEATGKTEGFIRASDKDYEELRNDMKIYEEFLNKKSGESKEVTLPKK